MKPGLNRSINPAMWDAAFAASMVADIHARLPRGLTTAQACHYAAADVEVHRQIADAVVDAAHPVPKGRGKADR